jgi:hypothetical protein
LKGGLAKYIYGINIVKIFKVKEGHDTISGNGNK